MNLERIDRLWKDRFACGSRARRVSRTVARFLLIAGVSVSCSETHEPLEWRDAVRDDLNPTPSTLASSALIDSSASYTPRFPVGASSYFLVGRLDRAEAVIESDAYLRWDLADLPEGAVTGAALQLVLRDLEQADTLSPGPFALWMYAVDETWSETTLDTLLARGDFTFIAGSGNLDTSGGTDTSDVALTELFEDDSDLLDLIASWRSNPDANHGIALILTAESGEGFLRLVSREGSPRGTVSTVATPALLIEIDTGPGDTTITREPVEDTYVTGVVSGAVAPPDSLLLVGSGFVSRAWLTLDLMRLIGQPSGPPPGGVVHRANLHLSIDPENVWRLRGDETMTLQLYEVSGSAPEDPAPDPADAILVTQRTVAAGDSAVDLDAFAPVQRIFEGRDLWLLLSAETEAGVFRSVAILDETARRSPRFEIVYSKPIGDRFPERE